MEHLVALVVDNVESLAKFGEKLIAHINYEKTIIMSGPGEINGAIRTTLMYNLRAQEAVIVSLGNKNKGHRSHQSQAIMNEIYEEGKEFNWVVILVSDRDTAPTFLQFYDFHRNKRQTTTSPLKWDDDTIAILDIETGIITTI